jgi:hypothetical protein
MRCATWPTQDRQHRDRLLGLRDRAERGLTKRSRADGRRRFTKKRGEGRTCPRRQCVAYAAQSDALRFAGARAFPAGPSLRHRCLSETGLSKPYDPRRPPRPEALKEAYLCFSTVLPYLLSGVSVGGQYA